jgi:hypothetical protein
MRLSSSRVREPKIVRALVRRGAWAWLITPIPVTKVAWLPSRDSVHLSAAAGPDTRHKPGLAGVRMSDGEQRPGGDHVDWDTIITRRTAR